LNCDFYGLSALDAAVTLKPHPIGFSALYYLYVDGVSGTDIGNFNLHIKKVKHDNNPCSANADDARIPNASDGGTFLGNIYGYVNDSIIVQNDEPCHHAGMGGDTKWPAKAWFVLAPGVAATYDIETYESWAGADDPKDWFDTVISIYKVNVGAGSSLCSANKVFVQCAHVCDGCINSRNPDPNGGWPDFSTKIAGLNVAGNETYLIGISAYEKYDAGNYRLVVTRY